MRRRRPCGCEEEVATVPGTGEVVSVIATWPCARHRPDPDQADQFEAARFHPVGCACTACVAYFGLDPDHD
jgi:hypothetical protein